MRLGAMLSGSSIVNLRKSEILVNEKTIILTLKKSALELAADTVERRLEALATGLNMGYSIKTKEKK